MGLINAPGVLFHSVQFLVFLVAVFGAYWLLADNARARKWLLLLASATFYCAWKPQFFLLILYCATFDFFAARAIERAQHQKLRKALLVTSVLSNVGVLCFFKYSNFFLTQIASVASLIDPALKQGVLQGADLFASFIGIGMKEEKFDVILPIGLSFIIFQTLSYTIDVYRKELKARDSWLDVIVYVSFFSHQVAGPIVRGSDFLPQLDVRPQLTSEKGAVALLRIAKGMVKKLLIADLLAANIVDRVFASPDLYSPVEVWVAVFGYTLQIYYDFSAYSDIAIGSAAMFGIHFKENFDRPYKSRNLSEFWRRWHISLSTWLRDYLYIPLGGNRGGKLVTCRNVIITMVLGGIWHGADWRMALWGLVHGVGLSLNRWWWWTFGATDPDKAPWWRNGIAWFFTFTVVMLARVFFRAPTFGQALDVFGAMAGTGLEAPNVTAQVLVVLGIATAIHFGPSNLFDRAAGLFVRVPIPVRAAALVGIALVIKTIATFDVQPFYYYQF